MASHESTPQVPEELAAFLRRHVPSLHQLDILLALFHHAARAWTAAELAQQLYLPPELVEERLADLRRRDLIHMPPGSDPPRYQARDEHAELIQRLARFYAERRVTVISFIFAQPNETVRSFADAFKLRKDS